MELLVRYAGRKFSENDQRGGVWNNYLPIIKKYYQCLLLLSKNEAKNSGLRSFLVILSPLKTRDPLYYQGIILCSRGLRITPMKAS